MADAIARNGYKWDRPANRLPVKCRKSDRAALIVFHMAGMRSGGSHDEDNNKTRRCNRLHKNLEIIFMKGYFF